MQSRPWNSANIWTVPVPTDEAVIVWVDHFGHYPHLHLHFFECLGHRVLILIRRGRKIQESVLTTLSSFINTS